MGDNPRSEYQKRRKEINDLAFDNAITPDDREALIDFLDAYDRLSSNPTPPKGDDTKADKTLVSYASTLKCAFQRHNGEMRTASVETINGFLDSLRDGTHDSVKDSGLSQNSVHRYSAHLRKFYRYHDFNVNPDDIHLPSKPESKVDDRDMFDWDEIEEMRDVINHPRDRCLFELLLNTGQRVKAIQTLRIKDVDVEEGVFWLNTDEYGESNGGGLKKHRSGKLPLLGAVAAVREWLKYHPNTEDPDAYLITQKQDYPGNGKDHGDMLSHPSIDRILRRIGKEAGVTKPVNAHNFRHVWTTIAKRDYELDDTTIKRIRGDAKGSRVMETTYVHLSDEDAIEKAEVGAGIREKEPESTLTPQSCPTCGEGLAPDAKACGNCGTVFTPDAQSAKEQIDEEMYETAKEIDSEDESDKLDALRDYLQKNPEALEELIGD